MDRQPKLNNSTPVIFIFLIVAGFLLIDFGFATSIFNVTSTTVFVVNTPPALHFANVSPDPAIPSQTLTYTANITDPNSDTVRANITYYNTTNGARSGVISLDVTGLTHTNNSFVLPANAEPGTWSVNITYTDGYVIRVNVTTFTVNTVLATTLQNSPVDFGNQTVGQTAQRAENGSAVTAIYAGTVKGFPLILNNTGNLMANYSINGTNLVGETDSAKIIGVGNVTFNITDTGSGSRAGKIAVPSGAPTTIANGVSAASVQNVYFWLDTPNGITQQRYTGNVTIETKSYS